MQDNYWIEREIQLLADKDNDPIAHALAKQVKKVLPTAYVVKIRDNCYMAFYGWSHTFISADRLLVRDYGGSHTPDKIEDAIAAIIEENARWEAQYNKKLLKHEKLYDPYKNEYPEVTADD